MLLSSTYFFCSICLIYKGEGKNEERQHMASSGLLRKPYLIKKIIKKKLGYSFHYIEIHDHVFLPLASIPKVWPVLRKTPSCAHEFMAIFEDFSAQWNTDTMENHDYRGRDRQPFNLLRVTYLEDWINLPSVSTKMQWKKSTWNLLELIQDMQFHF